MKSSFSNLTTTTSVITTTILMTLYLLSHAALPASATNLAHAHLDHGVADTDGHANEEHGQYIEEDYLENETDTSDDEDEIGDDDDDDGGYWNPRNVPVGTHTFPGGKVLTSWLPLEPRILEYCKSHDCEEESRRLEKEGAAGMGRQRMEL